MTLRRLGVLQWVGLLLGAVVWFAQHIAGWGLTEAACDSADFNISHDLWQGVAAAVSIALILAAGAAATMVLFRTRGVTYEDDPPAGRLRFLAIAAVVANVIFLVIILLDGTAAIVNTACRQA
jgi:heme/copper-type cytochrome/quinol oxidase subunit 2